MNSMSSMHSAAEDRLFTLGEAQALLPGSTLVGDPATPLFRVHSDTRTLQAGDFFVALRGERFDAHDFLAQARAAGAAAALAEHGLHEAALPGLLVPDSLKALQQLAAAWRQRCGTRLIAVTGSNGKTTVTQMIASILRTWAGESALATAGNLNNHIGVPLTLLRLRPGLHRVGVIELGMNHPGEIAELAAIAAPDVALVNNAQREHQEFMKSVEAVARENGSVLANLPAQGCAVFPAADAFTPVWQAQAGARSTMRFALVEDGLAPTDDLCIGSADWVGNGWMVRAETPDGELEWDLQMAGRHNVRNALAAAAAALAAGCPSEAVATGLAEFEPVRGRSQLDELRWSGQDIPLVDDTYNANPDSVRAAIDVLASLPGPRWLLLGDMGEVGDQGPAFHEEVGAYARERGIEHFWSAGTLAAHAAEAFGAQARHHADTSALVSLLQDRQVMLPTAAAILVKGSRFMKMETAVAALRQRSQQAEPPSEMSHAG